MHERVGETMSEPLFFVFAFENGARTDDANAFFKSRRYSLKMYNNLVERCFSTCVQSFRRKSLEKDEERVRFIDERRRVDDLLTVSFVLFLP